MMEGNKMSGWHIIEFFVNMIDATLLFAFTYMMMRETRIKFLKVFIAVIIQATINSIANIYFGIGSLMGLIIMLLSTGFILHLTFRWESMKTYFYCAMGIVLMLITELLSMGMIVIITKLAPNIYYKLNTHRMIAIIVAKALYVLVLLIFKKRIVKDLKFDTTIRYQIMIIISFNILIGFLALWFYKYTYILKGHEIRYLIFMSLGAILFSVNVSTIIKKMSDQINKEAVWRAKERAFERQKFYTSSIEEMLKQMKAERHDFNHHVGCLYGLLHMGKMEEALSYIDLLTKNREKFNYYINIEEPVVASILNTKLARGKKEDIEISLNMNLPRELSIEPIDLSIILGNLLDNALEACDKLSKAIRKISMEMHIRNQYLIIKINNNKSSEEYSIAKKGFKTKKEDIDNHGFGLANVKKVVKKLNGIIEVEDLGEEFKVNIAIPIENDAN